MEKWEETQNRIVIADQFANRDEYSATEYSTKAIKLNKPLSAPAAAVVNLEIEEVWDETEEEEWNRLFSNFATCYFVFANGGAKQQNLFHFSWTFAMQ